MSTFMRFFCISYAIQTEGKPAEFDNLVLNWKDHPSRVEIEDQISRQFGCNKDDLKILGISEFKSEADASIWKGSEPFFERE